MTEADWRRVLDQAAALGVQMVQYIGGEPTMHPALPALVQHALGMGMAVEVFSHLAHVTPELWEVFARQGVSLATSYYADNASQHEAITQRRGSYADTQANIAKAVALGIPIRAGVIDGLVDEQRAAQARTQLVDLGVPSIGYDRLRLVGRGARGAKASIEQLCGHCGDGVAAISPDGAVWPCVFSRWLSFGSVLGADLATVLASRQAQQVRADLADTFAARPAGTSSVTTTMSKCGPDPCYPDCNPTPCQPTCSPRCSPSCSPCAPSRRCWPYYR